MKFLKSNITTVYLYETLAIKDTASTDILAN